MFKRQQMKAEDYRCLYCGSGLELTIEKLVIGENPGACPMCSEPYLIKITREEMEILFESAEEIPLKKANNIQ